MWEMACSSSAALFGSGKSIAIISSCIPLCYYILTLSSLPVIDRREILDDNKRPFDWDVAGKPIFLIYILTLPYSLLLMMLEYSTDGGSGGVFGRLLRRMRGSIEAFSLRCQGIQKQRMELHCC